MAMVVLTSEPNTKTSKALSFPSYLNCGDEESFELKIGEPSRGINPFISGTRKHVDGEIDVFSAEKYFSEAVEAEECTKNAAISTPKYHHKKDDPTEEVVVVVDPVKPKSRPRTPSIRSESSWNSRSLLVQKVPRTDKQPKNSSRFGRKSFLASIGCNYCSCRNKNSLDVEEKSGEISFNRSEKLPVIRSRDSVQIKDFPVFYPRQVNQGAKKKLQEEEEEMKRNSIEVFGSPVLDKPGRKSFNLDRRLTMVAWDAIAPRSEPENPLSSNGIDYDTGSEASSDLFEIESFPGNSNPFLPCVTPTTSYAPSEASIEWSVVTASAADFSVASDTEEPKMLSSSSASFHRSIQNGRELMGKEKAKRLPSILLGCKSQKAVVVAGDAYRTASEKAAPGGARRHHSSDAFLPLTRFHAESKIAAGFGLRNAGSFSASISNREGHVLYI